MRPSRRATAVRIASALLVAALPATLRAQTPQDSARAALDSLGDRLEQAERRIERLQRQLEDQAQAKIQSRSRNRLEISGLILFNGFYNSTKVNNSDVPTFVAQPVAADTALPDPAHVAGQVRQSRLGFALSGSRALGADLSAELQLDFYGGQLPSAGGRTFPLPRIRTAFVKLDWRHIGLLVGQETQIVSPLNPVSFASVGIPGFTSAGNLWFWVPQLRLTYETGVRPRLGLQAAALAPMLGSAQSAFLTTADSAERSSRPMVQAHAYIGWGEGDTESQIGVGIHRGWIGTPSGALLASEAYSADMRLALGEHIQLLGEAFVNGQALAGLGGGGIGQQFGLSGVPVKTKGGWVQLNVRPNLMLEFGAGAGIDDPDESLLPPATGRGRNLVYEGHAHLRPGGGLIVGAEYRRIQTDYAAGALTAHHVNAFMGVAF